ncbi:hypothetical protein [Piscirickettsia salmonis]|uniref:hypothetical protein n=1 Tax=Piscirickettsia salmonis TaxID=1238 RepID=UPI0018AC9D00|nr:hypothetical protein [Piscirickettsia salmonis]
MGVNSLLGVALHMTEGGVYQFGDSCISDYGSFHHFLTCLSFKNQIVKLGFYLN